MSAPTKEADNHMQRTHPIVVAIAHSQRHVSLGVLYGAAFHECAGQRRKQTNGYSSSYAFTTIVLVVTDVLRRVIVVAVRDALKRSVFRGICESVQGRT